MQLLEIVGEVEISLWRILNENVDDSFDITWCFKM